MDRGRTATVQLAARISPGLRHRLRIHCVEHGIPIGDFIAAALGEALGRRTDRDRH
jgi:hypothetical protein